jgi:hypothetical protein
MRVETSSILVHGAMGQRGFDSHFPDESLVEPKLALGVPSYDQGESRVRIPYEVIRGSLIGVTGNMPPLYVWEDRFDSGVADRVDHG